MDRTGLSEEEKLELTIDILKITQGMYKYTKHAEGPAGSPLMGPIYHYKMFMCILPVSCKN